VLTASPHVGHHALVQLASHFKSITMVTQNVDRLHQRAGSADVIELHGSLEAFRCIGVGHLWDPGPCDDRRARDASAPAPVCEICGALVRPGVVWFGESLPADAVRTACASVEAADAVLVVGTSAIVRPAAALPLVAQQHGASVIEINPDRTPLSRTAAVAWSERAGAALPTLAHGWSEIGLHEEGP
jgi:NAD-dependent deacetylase